MNFPREYIYSKDLQFSLKICMNLFKTYQTKRKIEISGSIVIHFSSKVLFFLSKVPIVARRCGCQLAATVPVLLFTWAIALCYELISIVARRRGCQLATTAPVLLFTWAIALCYELCSCV